MDSGPGLPTWRTAQGSTLSRIAESLRPLDAELKAAAQRPPHVTILAQGVHVALFCALVDALDWPDTELPTAFLTGLPVLGRIPDSGVFRLLHDTQPEATFDKTYSTNCWVSAKALS